MSDKKHHSKGDSWQKGLLCVFSSFLLAVCFTIIALFLSAKLGFVNQSQITKAFDDSDYYNRAYKAVVSNCENEATASGLSENIFANAFSLEEMKGHCLTYAIETLKGDTYVIDTEAMENKIAENVRAYTAENNLAVDGDLETVIQNFTSNIADYYKSAVRFPYLDQVASIFRIFDKVMRYIMICVAFFAIILFFVLFRLNTYKKNRFFRYVAYSLLSASLSTLIIPVFCYISGFYKRIAFSPEYVYRYIVAYMENGLRSFVITGIIFGGAGLVAIVISALIKSKLKKEHVPASSHHHHHSER